ncbi:MAG: tetratricopeptide repeat protein [Cyclobacteriaceae bacterium]
MKRSILLTAILAISIAGFSQKKPKINKANSLREKGELAEAKAIIDDAIEFEKIKDNGKTWYYRALIYATIDTTSNAEKAALSDNALEEAVAAFAKANELGDPEKEYFITNEIGLPVSQSQQEDTYYSYYFNTAIEAFEAQEFQTAVDQFYKSEQVKPGDTNSFKNAAYAAHNGELWDAAIKGYSDAIDAGAKSLDMFLNLVSIQSTVKEDSEAALAAVRRGREAYPLNSDLAKNEINLLIKLDMVEDAKNNLEAAIADEPDNTNLIFTLAAMYEELDQVDKAMETYNRALDVDPNHFESNFNKGVILLNKANEVFKEYTNLGISKADQKKARELKPVIKEKYGEALPQWEKLWEIRSTDKQVGETLAYIYNRLERYDEAEKVQEAAESLPE